MKFENLKSDGMHYEYKVVLSAEEIENQIVEAVKERTKTFKMQGFRPGHVPFDIVRSNVENSVIKNVLDSLISKACDDVIKETKVSDLASRPTYKFENNYEKNKDVSLVLTFEVAPSFELKPYELEIEKVVPNVNDKDIEDARNNLMLYSPIYDKADRSYEVKAKDEVSYHAVCYNQGVESKKKSFSNTVLIPDAIPEGAEFLSNFVGKKIDESFDFVPATDKNLKYKITVTAIKKALTDLSADDYAQRRGFKSLKELDDAIKEKLENDINAQAFLYHKNQILEILDKQYKFELPQGVVEQEMKAVIASVKREEANEARKAGKDAKPQEQKTDEEMKTEYADVVNKRVLLGYVLNKIAKEEKIEASDREVQNAIIAEINKNPATAQAMVEFYSKNPGAVSYKRAEIIEHKVVSFLVSKAKGKEVSKTRQEIDDIVKKLLDD